MKATEAGVEIGRDELACLLEFTAKGEEAGDLAAVRFRVDPALNEVHGYSTDGIRAVAVEAPTAEEGAPRGEWLVRSRYLKQVYKLIPAKGAAVLHFSGASLIQSTVYSAPDDEGDRAELPSVVAVQDECLHQVQIAGADVLDDLCRQPGVTSAPRSPEVRIQGPYLASMDKLSKAADGAVVEIHVGETELDPVRFVSSSTGTVWIAVVMPCRPYEPTPSRGEDEEEAPQSDERQSNLFSETGTQGRRVKRGGR